MLFKNVCSMVLTKCKFKKPLLGFDPCLSIGTRILKANASSVDLTGIFPPIPTSFCPDESISYSDIEKNFDVWNSKSFAGSAGSLDSKSVCDFLEVSILLLVYRSVPCRILTSANLPK